MHRKSDEDAGTQILFLVPSQLKPEPTFADENKIKKNSVGNNCALYLNESV